MLVISRKNGEAVKIGEDIEITIISLKDGSVKLSIEAPKNITILRKELVDEVEESNREATKVDLNLLKTADFSMKKNR